MLSQELRNPLRKILHRPADSHKYDFGHALIIGGSPGMVGAPFLAARSALRIGAGLVSIASYPEVIDKLEKRVEEIMTFRLGDVGGFIKDRKVSVTVVGPGLPPETAQEVFKQIPADLPLIIDGGGLGALQGRLNLLKRYDKAVLTPHAGEFKRLIDGASSNKEYGLVNAAAKLSDEYNVTVVLKGHPTTVIYNNHVYQNSSGGPALATAGTGDVLAGMIAGLTAQGLELFEASKLAVYLHGLAGDLATQSKTEPGVIASDVIELIPKALKLADRES